MEKKMEACITKLVVIIVFPDFCFNYIDIYICTKSQYEIYPFFPWVSVKKGLRSTCLILRLKSKLFYWLYYFNEQQKLP